MEVIGKRRREVVASRTQVERSGFSIQKSIKRREANDESDKD